MSKFVINGHSVQDELKKLSKLGNKHFTQCLHPGVDHILGVRLPALRKLAKEIVRLDWTCYLSQEETFYMEERTLYGLVLGYIPSKVNVEEYLDRVTQIGRASCRERV